MCPAWMTPTLVRLTASRDAEGKIPLGFEATFTSVVQYRYGPVS